MSNWRGWLFAIAALALLATVLPVVVYSARLPDPIATHWAGTGAPNGATAKQFTLAIPTALIGGALLLSLLGSTRAEADGRAVRLAIVTFVSGVAATTSGTIVERNLDKVTWRDADAQTLGLLALQLGIPLAAAALAYVLARRAWPDVPSSATAPVGPRIQLGIGARAYWTGSASNRWLLGIGVYVLLQRIVLLTLLPPLRIAPIAAALHVVILAAIASLARIRVTIDTRGVAVRYGVLPLWTQHVPLDRILGAQAVHLDPLAHGGWGYRGSLTLFRRAAIVVRGGDALRIDLNGGRALFITVDDAATAARLLRSLVQQAVDTARAHA